MFEVLNGNKSRSWVNFINFVTIKKKLKSSSPKNGTALTQLYIHFMKCNDQAI